MSESTNGEILKELKSLREDIGKGVDQQVRPLSLSS